MTIYLKCPRKPIERDGKRIDCGVAFEYNGNSNWSTNCPKCGTRITFGKNIITEKEYLKLKNK